MKKFIRVFGCTAGGALIGFYAKLLDTTIGCLCKLPFLECKLIYDN